MSVLRRIEGLSFAQHRSRFARSAVLELAAPDVPGPFCVTVDHGEAMSETSSAPSAEQDPQPVTQPQLRYTTAWAHRLTESPSADARQRQQPLLELEDP